MSTTSHWLEYAQRLAALAQSGMAYCRNPYDLERYHQMCEIAAEMMAESSGEPVEHVLGLLDNQAGYATPKLDGRGVVFCDDKILLVRELADGGRWTLPGGWVDVGEPPRLAVEREVREESGYEVKATKLLALYDRELHGHPPHLFHTYKIFILCELLGGAPTESLETGGADFFEPDALPELSISRTTTGEIQRMFEHHHNPNLPTDLD
jgi:ADP-ribose pyrophosphatase YjhB (NUDIX family)